MKVRPQTTAVTVLKTVDEEQPGWRARVHHPDGRTSNLELIPLDTAIARPTVLDGLVAAVLPIAMRTGGTLRVEGSLTRGALRNFIEFAEAWSNWRPDQFHRIAVQATHLVDGQRSATGHTALAAWSGSLRSTHTLVRHRDALLQAPFTLRGALRVWGLHPAERNADHRQALAPARDALAELGLPLLVVRAHADDIFTDPEIGSLPLVAAALHLVGAGCAVGLHARSWLFTAQQRYPRPGPVLPDLLSGDAFSVRADGGTTSPPAMLRAVLQHPTLARVISDCETSPRHAPPCGRCVRCALLALAWSAAGGDNQPYPTRWLATARIPLADPCRAAEAEAILQDDSDTKDIARTLLAARTTINRTKLRLRDTCRWLGAAVGLRKPWPR